MCIGAFAIQKNGAEMPRFFVYDGDMHQGNSGARKEPHGYVSEKLRRKEPQGLNQTDRAEGNGLHPSRLRRVTFLREAGFGKFSQNTEWAERRLLP